MREKRIVLVASGSSARKMRHGANNWLPGRIQLQQLHPLTWEERGLLSGREGDHDLLEERMLYGGLPGVIRETNVDVRRDLLSSYKALYLEEEIRQEAAVRRLPPFAAFLRLAALESGQSPNVSPGDRPPLALPPRRPGPALAGIPRFAQDHRQQRAVRLCDNSTGRPGRS